MGDNLEVANEKLLAQLRDMGLEDEPTFDKDDWLEQQEPHMRKRLEALDRNQRDIDVLLKEFAQAKRALDLKYEKLLEPRYQGRADIVKGDTVPIGGEGPEVGIPGFWLKVLQSHSELEERINETDAVILKHLVDLKGQRTSPSDHGDSSFGFIVKFIFAPNQYFNETELVLKGVFADEEETVIKGIDKTPISWKSNAKNPTVKIMTKNRRGASCKVKIEPVESFFTLFTSAELPSDGIIGMNEYEDMKEDAEDCLAVATLLMEDMIPHAVKYFSGEKTFDVDFELGSGDDHDGDDDHDDDDVSCEIDDNHDGHDDDGAVVGENMEVSALQAGSKTCDGEATVPDQDCKQQ